MHGTVFQIAKPAIWECQVRVSGPGPLSLRLIQSNLWSAVEIWQISEMPHLVYRLLVLFSADLI